MRCVVPVPLSSGSADKFPVRKVGHNNYKAFLLFLWYGGALGAFVGTTTILELMSFVDDSPDVRRSVAQTARFELKSCISRTTSWPR